MIREHSAGGVVFRSGGGKLEVLLVATRGGRRWQLPKGQVETFEKPEETAQREVAEEGGVVARVLAPAGSITYWYMRGGQKVKKQVDFFVMEYDRGDPSEHDWEVDDAAFFPVEEAIRRLSFKNEREVLQAALEVYCRLRECPEEP